MWLHQASEPNVQELVLLEKPRSDPGMSTEQVTGAEVQGHLFVGDDPMDNAVG